MINIPKICAIAVSTMVGLTGITGCGTQSTDSTNSSVNIGILKWVTHGALDESEKGFIDALKNGGYIEGENLNLDRQNANDDVSIASSIATKFVNNNTDLVLAIATPAVQSMQSQTTTIPILGTAVTDYVGANLVQSDQNPGGNISGTTDRIPVKAQIDLLKEVLPNIKKLGILYNSSEVNSEIQAKSTQEYAQSQGIEVQVKTISSISDIQQTASSLANEVEALWLPTDNKIASAIGALSEITIAKKIPIVCGERDMVKAGGTLTDGINYYQLGYQTGEMALRILKDNANISNMPIEALNETSLAINLKNANEIGLTIPQTILDKAKEKFE